MSVTVYLNLGSNLERERHLRDGLDRLLAEHDSLAVSSVYESAAIGFEGPPFYNLCVSLETGLGVAAMLDGLRAIEAASGRVRDGPRFSDRTLDIDLLLYGDLTGDCDGVRLPRADIVEHAFVLAPLAEIAPATRHTDGRTYAAIWRELGPRFEAGPECLRVVPFEWCGVDLSASPGASLFDAGSDVE